MIDLDALFERHKAKVLEDRDPSELHGSDLHSCDYALWNRLHGMAELPIDDKAFEVFERGYAYEGRMRLALEDNLPPGFEIVKIDKIEYAGIVGHPDFVIYEKGILTPYAVVDGYTTARNSTEYSYGHALKTAFYAMAMDAPHFAEWVWQIGFGGAVKAHEAHWFDVREWLDDVEAALADKRRWLTTERPEPEPPIDPQTGKRETWRCEKGYCRAICPKNVRMK